MKKYIHMESLGLGVGDAGTRNKGLGLVKRGQKHKCTGKMMKPNGRGSSQNKQAKTFANGQLTQVKIFSLDSNDLNCKMTSYHL